MRNDNLKSSHKELASIPFEQAVKSPDFRVIEDLTKNIVFDYGEVSNSLQFHDADGHGALRVRDLHILREVNRALPEMHDARLSLAALNSTMQHMNTLEGQHALLKLAQHHFDDWSLLNAMRDYVDDNERKYGLEWIVKFKVMAPIHPDEFGDEANIPDERPLPPFSNKAIHDQLRKWQPH